MDGLIKFIEENVLDLTCGEYDGPKDMTLHQLIQMRVEVENAIRIAAKNCTLTKCDGCRECTK